MVEIWTEIAALVVVVFEEALVDEMAMGLPSAVVVAVRLDSIESLGPDTKPKSLVRPCWRVAAASDPRGGLGKMLKLVDLNS